MPASAKREPVSVVILTRNEAEILPRCLGELSWADEILVVDSESTDDTVAVAESFGARVIQQPWLGFSAQRNRGAEAAKNDWILALDTDEVATRTLVASIRDVLAHEPDPRDGFAVDRRDEFWGELMPRTARAAKQLGKVRLYHRGFSRWDEDMVVHEEVTVPGRRQLLTGTLLHWRPQTQTENAQRIVRYSEVEAEVLASGDQVPSRLKVLVMPVVRFIWLYLVKGSWRKGDAGLVNSMNRSFADYLRYANLLESHRPPVPADPPRSLIDS